LNLLFDIDYFTFCFKKIRNIAHSVSYTALNKYGIVITIENALRTFRLRVTKICQEDKNTNETEPKGEAIE
jgi:hypothetical protein